MQLPVPNTTAITCNRGGNLEIKSAELKSFIQISLEEAIDLLLMAQEGANKDPGNPRAGVHRVALSRIMEAKDAFESIAKTI